MMQLELATAEYIGARAQQQDLAAAIALKAGALLVLADGLGGHESGAEASRIVVETFREAASAGVFEKPEQRRQALRDTIERANARIGEGVDPAHGHRGMASTAVAAIVSEGELSWVSVGDSHLYVWRGNRLAKLNEDHSQAGLMIRSGQYKPGDPEVQAVKSVLVSALTGRKLEIVDLPEKTFKVESGDVLMLASDGLNTLDDDEIGQIVSDRTGEGAVRLSTVLLETVRARRLERQDNTTVAVARVIASANRSSRASDAMERTVTHQVTVPTEIAAEQKTEPPGAAGPTETPAPARAAPAAIAAAMSKAAEASKTGAPLDTAKDGAADAPTGPSVGDAKAAAGAPLAARKPDAPPTPPPNQPIGEVEAKLPVSTLRTDPLPATPAATVAAAAAAASAEVVKPSTRPTPPPAREPSPQSPPAETSKARGGRGRVIAGIVLLALALGVAAIGATAAIYPGWLSSVLAGLGLQAPDAAKPPAAEGEKAAPPPAEKAPAKAERPRVLEPLKAPVAPPAPEVKATPTGPATPTAAPSPATTEPAAKAPAAAPEAAAPAASPSAPVSPSPAAAADSKPAAPQPAGAETAAPQSSEAPKLLEQQQEVPKAIESPKPATRPAANPARQN